MVCQLSTTSPAAASASPALVILVLMDGTTSVGAVHQDQDKYDSMPEPDDDENDMLDLAFALTDT